MKWTYTISKSIGNENLKGKRCRVVKEDQSLDIFGAIVWVQIDDKFKHELWISKSMLKPIGGKK